MSGSFSRGFDDLKAADDYSSTITLEQYRRNQEALDDEGVKVVVVQERPSGSRLA